MTVRVLAWPAPLEVRGKFPRSTLLAIVILVCASIWFIELPLRIRFLLSLPAMNGALAEAQSVSPGAIGYPRSAGLFHIATMQPPSSRGVVWRFYKSKNMDSGFGYADTPIRYAGVNAGAGGHLFRGWYWFSDD